nr:MAG TPA: Putative Holliday junction resolvase [Caudoviricetes sp.]
MATILSLDPGGTTGYAILDVQEDEFPEVINVGQIKNGLSGFIDFYNDYLSAFNFDAIICESFTLREGIFGADLSPVSVIGALEALAQDVEIVYQEPKLKPLCDDDRLKRLGLHLSARPHANDAVRHGIIYLRNKKHTPTLEKGWK